MTDLAAQPPSFEAMAASAPEGFSVSERILEPVILIGREDGRIQVRLGGRRVVRGEERVLAAPSPRHAWVVDGNVLRPIPADAPALLSRMLGDEPAENISYPTAIRLLRSRSDEIAVRAAPDVLHAGKLAAEELSAEVDIPGLHADLFPYQARGVQWMWETVNRTGGLILADEMGLGKTLQIIALLLLDPPEKTAPALIVCPTSLIANWVREFHKFAPGISVMVHRGAHRAGIYRDLQVASVVITTYETMVNDISIFSSFEWSWVICDEAQAIKNPHSNRRKAIVTIPRRHSIPMTGTPVENTLLDLWSLADFAIPGMLGDRTVFEVEFPDTVEAGKALGALTDPVILKRRVRDVAADLPARIDIDLPVELDDRLARHYDDVREATLRKYPVAGALVATLQLQLVCAHPWLRVAIGLVRCVEIAPLLRDTAELVVGAGGRVLIAEPDLDLEGLATGLLRRVEIAPQLRDHAELVVGACSLELIAEPEEDLEGLAIGLLRRVEIATLLRDTAELVVGDRAPKFRLPACGIGKPVDRAQHRFVALLRRRELAKLQKRGGGIAGDFDGIPAQFLGQAGLGIGREPVDHPFGQTDRRAVLARRFVIFPLRLVKQIDRLVADQRRVERGGKRVELDPCQKQPDLAFLRLLAIDQLQDRSADVAGMGSKRAVDRVTFCRAGRLGQFARQKPRQRRLDRQIPHLRRARVVMSLHQPKALHRRQHLFQPCERQIGQRRFRLQRGEVPLQPSHEKRRTERR